jgi:hypothetical protein
MHSYGIAFRGGSENKEDIEGRGRVTSGVVCNVRMQVEVEKVAKECPEEICEYGQLSSVQVNLPPFNTTT